MAVHTASQVAKWFLARNRREMSEAGAEPISNLKLQKLLYYAQGCFLAATEDPLFDDAIFAWQHGPVVPGVYREYNANGANGISFEDDFDESTFSAGEIVLLNEVFSVFGQYSAWKLRNMTHDETPWKVTPINCEISKDVIREYFKQEYIE